jgi:monodictyphenone polyketide synthase
MSKLEVIYFGNELPKEDLQDVFRRLHNHSKDARHPLLARFIANSTQAIKDEVCRLPSEMNQLIPPFETILSWAENNDLREGLICGAVDGALLTIAQIGTYIG